MDAAYFGGEGVPGIAAGGDDFLVGVEDIGACVPLMPDFMKGLILYQRPDETTCWLPLVSEATAEAAAYAAEAL